MSPLVSILIPVYNCEKWVARAVESALAQTWTHKEVVVLDDGSTDGSFDVAKLFAGRVHIERQPNSGQNAARNRLTELSHGQYLVYLDADDELATDSVEKKMAMIDNADALYGTIEVASFLGSEKTRCTIYPAPEVKDPIAAAFNWSFPNTSAFIFRKSAIEEVGGWNEEIKNCTDYDMYFRLLLNEARFCAVPDAFSLYRQWSTSQAVYTDPLRKIRARLDLMWWAARRLHESGRLTPGRNDAFEQQAFGATRMIALFSHREASERHAQLKQWNPHFFPRTASRMFRAAYRVGGFDFAERTARVFRTINPAANAYRGIDLKSGLPYV